MAKAYGADGKPLVGDPSTDEREEERDEERRDDEPGDVLTTLLGGDE